MNMQQFNEGLLAFLGEATTPFHAARSLERACLDAGFVNAAERSPEPGGPGVVVRQGGSVIALRPGKNPLMSDGLRMVGAHTDSPCLMVKPAPELKASGYQQLGVQVYGGASRADAFGSCCSEIMVMLTPGLRPGVRRWRRY